MEEAKKEDTQESANSYKKETPFLAKSWRSENICQKCHVQNIDMMWVVQVS